jgi:hypothetical protein
LNARDGLHAEYFGQLVRALGRTVPHGNAGARFAQCPRSSASCSAGAENDRPLAARIERQGSDQPWGIGVLCVYVAVGREAERVGRADLSCCAAGAVSERQSRLLVWHGHVRPDEPGAGQRPDRLVEQVWGHRQQLVAPTLERELRECCTMHCR